MTGDALARLAANDVTDLDGLRALVRAADPEGRLAPIELGELRIGPGLVDALPDVVRGAGPVVVLGDATSIRAGERDVKAAAAELLGARRVSLGEHVHADEETVARARAAVAGAGCVVAVGSGTVSDLGKAALAGTDARLVVLQTAGSVNGFADPVSVLLRAGVKRTTPTRWADALLVDLDVLADAPARMTAAGFGDALAIWAAPADWRLASLTGMDAGWHPAAIAIVQGEARALLDDAAALGRGDRAALERLARVLTLGALAIGMTGGDTAAGSGAEHLVSHLLDMDAGARHAPIGLHGAQVGLATVLAAIAWAWVLEELDPADAELTVPEPASVREEIDAAFAHLDPDGSLRAECWRDCERKLERWRSCLPRARAMLADWDRHRATLRDLTRPPEELAAAMRAAGAPLRFGELDPPVAVETGRWALRHCHLMRDRFTVVDLLAALGRWDDDAVDAILDRAAALGAGR